MKNITSNDVILSYPFSGAIYAFLSDQQGAFHTKSQSGYYKTLFGKNYHKMMDIALTLAVLYENIIIPSVDVPLPNQQKYFVKDGYFNNDLGIKCFDYHLFENFPGYNETEKIIASDLTDLEIQNILFKIPYISKHQILYEAHEEIRLAAICRCRVLCSTRRSLLIKRILEKDYKDINIAVGQKLTIDAVEAYRKITGLTFNPTTIDEFQEIKSDSVIKSYARKFIDIVHEFNSDQDPEDQLFTAMATAMNTSKTAEKVSGIFSYSSSALGVIGLIPVVGSITGAIGLGTDALTRGAEFLKTRNEWYQLAPIIVQKRTERQIQNFVIQREKH